MRAREVPSSSAGTVNGTRSDTEFQRNLPEGHLMISQVIIDGAELVESLGVVVLQFGRCFKITDGFAHLAQLYEALSSELSGVNIPRTRLRKEERQKK